MNIYGEKEDGYASEFSITISELEVIEYEDDLKSEDEEDDSDYFLFKVVMKDGTALYFHSMYAD
ncbi:hypothetical protein [Brevibacillus sp. NRS-1366]|uniref:hypothetical protein n=1 Tax=Brevibacillus sp. NRS-1366 TaxID=3233899 RepID=UPI003D1E9049